MTVSYFIIRYIHFLSVFTVFACLLAQNLIIRRKITEKEINLLFRLDSIYGFVAIIAVIAGLTIWLSNSIGKPAQYYSGNVIFLVKVGLFILVGILSIVPSLFFRKSKKNVQGTPIVEVPDRIVSLLRLQLAILLILPLLAVLMAGGVG